MTLNQMWTLLVLAYQILVKTFELVKTEELTFEQVEKLLQDLLKVLDDQEYLDMFKE